MRKLKFLALLSLFVGGLTLSACKHDSPEAKVDKVSSMIASKLNFTDQQKALLADITTDIKADLADERARHNKMKDEVKAMVMNPELDQARLRQLFKEREQRMDQRLDKYLPKFAALHRTLTPEQRKQIVDKVDEHFNDE